MSSRVSTWITPACRNIASTACGGAAILRTAWPIGTPWVVRPERTAMIGLRSETRRAIRENLRGLPMDSRYIITTSVDSSSSQYCSRSLPDTSARLPALTNVERPRPRLRTFSRIAEPSAPDWQKNPARPRGGISPASDALIETAGSVLMMPSALGPISRTPYERDSPTSRRCRCRPSSPVSAKPDEITTRPCTPLAAQSSTTSSTDSAGTATIATSTSSWMSLTFLYVGSPDTARALGFTA